MSKLIKYISRYTWIILLCMMVIIVAAFADLQIPKCVKNMISKGLEQKGIEHSIPIVVTNDMMDKIMVLTSTKNRQYISKYYVSPSSISTSKFMYPKIYNKIDFNTLMEKNIYILSKMKKEDFKKLNSIIINPITMILSDNNIKIKEILINNTGLKLNIPIYDQIIKSDDNNIDNILQKINNNILKIKKGMTIDLISTGISDYYIKLGIDIKLIQNNCMVKYGYKMLIYTFLSEIPWLVNTFLASIFSTAVARDLRKDIFKKITKFSKAEMDKFTTSSLITRTNNDVTKVQEFLFFSLDAIFIAPILGIGAFIESYKSNATISYIILGIVFILIILTTFILSLLVPKHKVVQKLIDKINLISRENLNGLLSIRSFNAQKFEKSRFQEVNLNITKNNLFIGRVSALISPLIMFITSMAGVVITWVSYRYIQNYTLQVGEIVECINYTMLVIFSFVHMTMMLIDFPRAQVSSKRIAEVLYAPLSMHDKSSVDDNYNFKGKITFKNVSFKYPNVDNKIIDNISFTAKPGKITAIIGSTGSGKSTIIDLISRFYDVTKGEILLDDINIKNISQHQLRDQISYVPQKGSLFKGTIESNIKYGNSTATYEKMSEVVDIAQATNFILNKVDKFSSAISQGGTNVSGGQRQRVSIARAIIKKAKVYLFDDSFSALDFKTDLLIRKKLYPYIENATIIVVAQRVGTILNADQIIVLDQGRIVAKGTHQELIKNCQEYIDIASSQLDLEILK